MTYDTLLTLIQKGDLNEIRIIIENNRSCLNEIDESGFTLLHWAAYFDEVEVFNYLTSVDDTLINRKTDKGASVLHISVLQSSLRVIDHIGSDRTLIDIQNKWNETALHLAAAQGNTNIIHKLLSCNASQSLTDNWGRTPVDISIENGYTAVVGLFDAQYISGAKKDCVMGAAKDVSLIQNKSVIAEFMNKMKQPKSVSSEELASNNILVRHIFEDKVETLGKVEPTKSDTNTISNVSQQVASNDQPRPYPVRRISISQQIEYPGDPTRLSELVADTVKYDVNGRDMFGWTALHKCCMWDKWDLLEILLTSEELVVCMNSTNKDGFSALHCCVDAGAYRCAEKLLSLDSELRSELLLLVDGKSRTSLKFAQEKNELKIINLINRMA